LQYESDPCLRPQTENKHQPAESRPLSPGGEEEIVILVAQGLTNRQIASELSISEHTAATHVGRILKKVELHSRSQLATWISERGLPLPD
jgi:non-specific serine/threonine protein kinase